MKYLSLLLLLFSIQLESSSIGPCGEYITEDESNQGECIKIDTDHTDKASLQRGAKLYFNYCLGCHSLKFARYNRLAKDLEIPEEIFQQNLIFGDQKMGDLIEIGMSSKDAKDWFGVPPPDLTLETSLRGEDWVYTYLKSFYIDETRPLGVNNSVYKNVGMPNVLATLQGRQISVCKELPDIADNGGLKQDPLTGQIINITKCGFLEADQPGLMNEEEFDSAIFDLTNFLSYMADPIREERKSLGVYVILYLVIFSIFGYLLYREFKKDLH